MVSLKQIVVEKLGPLGDQTLELGRFNLVYGRNETGKTHLVEFLLRSLFRHAASWPMRAELGQGKVTVDGLGDDPIAFTPDTKEKLEDYWDESEAGLPTNMARLLVVKGAELELSDSSPEGIDRAVLKAALSSEALIDKIFDRIQATVRKARVVEGSIEANQTGLIKDRKNLEDDRERLSELSDSVENRYAQGQLRLLELAHTELQDELAQQNEAKRHAAYQLHQERTRIQTARNKLPQEQLESLTRDIDRYQVKQTGLTGLREKEAETKAEVMHYPWLRQAIELWERRGLEAPASGSNLYAFAAGVFLIFGLGLALAGLVLDLVALADLIFAVAAIAVFGVGLVLAYAYVVQIRRRANLAVNAADRHQIEIEFQQRFERAAGGLAGLKAQEQSLRESQARFEHLTEEVEASEAEIQSLAISVEGTFKGLHADAVPQESWSTTVTQLHAWAETQKDNIQKIDIRLTELGVDESDYRAEPAAIEFSADGSASWRTRIWRRTWRSGKPSGISKTSSRRSLAKPVTTLAHPGPNCSIAFARNAAKSIVSIERPPPASSARSGSPRCSNKSGPRRMRRFARDCRRPRLAYCSRRSPGGLVRWTMKTATWSSEAKPPTMILPLSAPPLKSRCCWRSGWALQAAWPAASRCS